MLDPLAFAILEGRVYKSKIHGHVFKTKAFENNETSRASAISYITFSNYWKNHYFFILSICNLNKTFVKTLNMPYCKDFNISLNVISECIVFVVGFRMIFLQILLIFDFIHGHQSLFEKSLATELFSNMFLDDNVLK